MGQCGWPCAIAYWLKSRPIHASAPATLPGDDAELARWLAGWRADGGDARRFRQGSATLFPGDEAAAWRYSEAIIVPLRPKIRRVARALLVYPKHLPYPVVEALADSA